MVQLSPVVRLTRLTRFKIMYQKWFMGTAKSPPYNHIVQIGDPVLRRKAKTIEPSAIPEQPMQKLLSRLYHVMKTTGMAGLSAPQLGVSLRVFAIQFPSKRKYEFPLMFEKRQMEYIPLQVWINPHMKILDYTKVTDEESCESMRGFSAQLPRYNKVLLTGLDHEGKEKKWEAKGWSARIVQHEMDHLEGKFYTDLMNPESLCCIHWDAVNKMEELMRVIEATHETAVEARGAPVYMLGVLHQQEEVLSVELSVMHVGFRRSDLYLDGRNGAWIMFYGT